MASVPKNHPRSVHFRVHLGVHEGPVGFPGPNLEIIMRSNYRGSTKVQEGSNYKRSMKVQEGSLVQIQRELCGKIIESD